MILGLLKLLFFVLLLLLVASAIVIVSAFRLLGKARDALFGRSARQDRQRRTTNSTTAGGDSRSASTSRKIFAEDEGEYVDFEEIR